MIPAVQPVNATWQLVHSIPRGTVLTKSRAGHESRPVMDAAAAIVHRFGCYSWESTGAVLYCGSFSKNYSGGQFKTNLEGRVYQYLVNHKRDTQGKPRNTNAKVFDLLNDVLRTRPARLQVLRLDALIVGGRRIEFGEYCGDAALVRAIERLVTWAYKAVGQCPWNDAAD